MLGGLGLSAPSTSVEGSRHRKENLQRRGTRNQLKSNGFREKIPDIDVAGKTACSCNVWCWIVAQGSPEVSLTFCYRQTANASPEKPGNMENLLPIIGRNLKLMDGLPGFKLRRCLHGKHRFVLLRFEFQFSEQKKSCADHIFISSSIQLILFFQKSKMLILPLISVLKQLHRSGMTTDYVHLTTCFNCCITLL